MENQHKYPKTYHLPFSLGLQNDDRRMEDESCFNGKQVAVTVKMDGENTSMYRDGIHARSLDSTHHPSRSVVKQIHAGIKHLIPRGWRICGENLYAKHSIHYTDLKSFFYVFSIWNDKNECLDLLQTQHMCYELGLTHVEIDSRIVLFDYEQHLDFLVHTYNHIIASGHEGIVIRNVMSYHYNDFQKNLAKAVRPNHVQTDVHWTKEWIPNELRKSNG
jgi:ATP-dependent RNA circularization protein (DNA/RNA ligase family)